MKRDDSLTVLSRRAVRGAVLAAIFGTSLPAGAGGSVSLSVGSGPNDYASGGLDAYWYPANGKWQFGGGYRENGTAGTDDTDTTQLTARITRYQNDYFSWGVNYGLQKDPTLRIESAGVNGRYQVSRLWQGKRATTLSLEFEYSDYEQKKPSALTGSTPGPGSVSLVQASAVPGPGPKPKPAPLPGGGAPGGGTPGSGTIGQPTVGDGPGAVPDSKRYTVGIEQVLSDRLSVNVTHSEYDYNRDPVEVFKYRASLGIPAITSTSNYMFAFPRRTTALGVNWAISSKVGLYVGYWDSTAAQEENNLQSISVSPSYSFNKTFSVSANVSRNRLETGDYTNYYDLVLQANY